MKSFALLLVQALGSGYEPIVEKFNLLSENYLEGIQESFSEIDWAKIECSDCEVRYQSGLD